MPAYSATYKDPHTQQCCPTGQLFSSVWQDFLRDYKKQPGFQAAFEYMQKMQASAKSHRTGMIPLFHLADTLATTTLETRATLDECGAVVVPEKEPGAQ